MALDNRLNHLYFSWLLSIVKLRPRNSHSRLLKKLFGSEFIFSHPMDENRLINGVSMRYRFGQANGYSDEYISENLSIFPCTFLEMMISLSFEQECILNTNSQIDRTDIWFNNMLQSSHLDQMDNQSYDEDLVNDILYGIISKSYLPNGDGGLFYVPNCPNDLRRVDIWTQMCWSIEFNNIK